MRMFFALALLSFFNQNQAVAGSHSPTPQTLIVECPDEIYLQEGQAFDTSVTGAPKVISNNGGAVNITWIEFFAPGNCSNMHDIVTRNFTIRNALGELERCSQRIYLRHHRPDNIHIPFDTTVSHPRDISFSEAVLGAKLPFRMISFTYTDSKISNGCNSPVRIRREWRFTDLCSGQVTQKISFINVLNYQNSFEHNRITEDAICEQEGFIEIIPKGEFGPYKYRWNTNDSTPVLVNLFPGIYSAVITDKFGCNQLQNVGLQSMSDKADVGGRIVTQNDYRVYPDSIYFGLPNNITKVCLSPNGGLHYGMTLKERKSGFMEYRLVKRSEPIEGISSRDIIYIQRHILSIEKFVDTLKYFAADVNNNKNVTASDITELRRIILGIKDNFTEVLPWYFLVHNWKQVIAPHQSFQSILFNGLQIINFPRTNADILAIKMGDIDLSYRRQLVGDRMESRAKNLDVFLMVQQKRTEPGEILEIPVFLKGQKGITGYQFSLNVCGDATLLDVESLQLSEENYHWDDQGLNVSYTDALGLNWDENKPILLLKIKSGSLQALLSNQLCLDGRLQPEFYDKEIDIHSLEILFERANPDERQFGIMPNPAADWFWITTDSHLPFQYEIINTQGQIIMSGTINGSEQIESNLFTNGIYSIRFFQSASLVGSKRILIHK
ncbi:MAG: T9SS type A sorting domain-containing protein [Saprospiraceae bacterium]|nr:T9SS type A sorting domain-containing protein [Saprospiraceae bacterium]